MSLARFTWTERARPFVELGIGDTRVSTIGRWDSARWDQPDALWAGTDPVWFDITCDCFRASWEYGRRATTDRFVAGVATVVVDNATGWADPNHIDSPTELTVRPGRQIRIGIDHAVFGRRVLFRGFIDAMTPTYAPTGPDTVDLACVDALGEVNRAKLVPLDAEVGAGEGASARATRILDAIAWSTSARDVWPSSEPLVGTTLGGQVADMLGQTADSAGGAVFGDTSGRVAFRPRDWQTFIPGSPVDGTIGNVEQGHVVPAVPAIPGYLAADGVRTVSTVDAPDLVITGNVRMTAYIRDDSAEAAASRYVAIQGAGTDLAWCFVSTYANAAYPAIGWPTGSSATQITLGNVLRTAWGPLTPAGADRYLGAVFTGVNPGVQTATLLTQRLTSTDGVTWTNHGTPAAAARADALTRDAAQPLRIGFGWLGRVYWAQLEAINRAQLAFPGVVGNYVSVPDSAALDIVDDIEIVARIAPTAWRPTAQQAIVGKYTATGNQRTFAFALAANTGQLVLVLSADGGTTTQAVSSSGIAVGTTGTLWVKVTRVRATGAVTFYTAPDAPTEAMSWTQLGTPITTAGTGGMFASTARVEVGAISTGTAQPFAGRIARVIVRNGIAGTTVLDVSENNAGGLAPGATTFVASSGQTVTIASTAPAVQPIVRPQADAVVWRFDASDYPGTGTSYVDPRGRTWTLSAAGAIVPKVPAVPEVVVPPDVCPVLWERPFNRADITTRAIIGRDLATAVVVDDTAGMAQYGIEPFERTDLLTQHDASLTMLANRVLRTRGAATAPRVRSVALNARTSDGALDLMSTADVYLPSRYRCRLLEARGLIFDGEYFATGVAHEITPSQWGLALNLDLAAPFAAQGGQWDRAYWDLATWTVVAP